MTRVLGVGFALMAAGSVVAALPDDGPRVFSFSRDHGPSGIDVVGIALVLTGWGVLAHAVWAWRRKVRQRLGVVAVALAGGAVLSGLVLVFWAVIGDRGAWWIAGVVVAAMPQAVVLGAAWWSE